MNPYQGHPQLTQLEADVLYEYSTLAKHVKDLCIRTRELAESPDKELLSQLRVLERKMGLVMTLFKASWWGHISAAAQDDNGDQTIAADQTVTT